VRFDTRLVHAGQEIEPGSGDVIPPVHLTTTFDQTAQDRPRYFYARGENPTRERLERCLAELEDARHALVFASGQAAGATALSLLSPGDCLVASAHLYGGTRQLFDLVARSGWEVGNCDVVVHAQEPKLTPHKPTIRANLADLLRVAPSAVNVKAKTGEHVGPIGRGEAIACEAIVLLKGLRTQD